MKDRFDPTPEPLGFEDLLLGQLNGLSEPLERGPYFDRFKGKLVCPNSVMKACGVARELRAFILQNRPLIRPNDAVGRRCIEISDAIQKIFRHQNV